MREDFTDKDVVASIRLAFDDLQRELMKDDPKRPFDCILTGCASRLYTVIV